ncbi:two-component sensor histidine kinase [Acinetobacter sp. ACNIH2]|uniref:sensor histidine kinase n=1 Tax=Acinetobacter sp. ACNIH2 TaxID=1758189 RepID=UPI000CDC7DDF|nr:ATP-binding protein [Acinetobacter sp. ACNIH2]AUX84739.1 two-component sensor histidine kinase [Acinetobacter sp. ACNIH2]
MAAKHISLQKRLVKTSVLSSVAAGAVAFALLVGISIYQSMSMQDEIMDEIADALLLVQPNQNEGAHITQLSDEFDLQYQLIHQQTVVLQSDSFELASMVNFLDMQHEHFDYVWFQHALWRSYQSFDQDTRLQVVIYQPMQVRFEKILSSFAIYAVLLMVLWLLQWLFSHFAIARQFKVMQMLSKKIADKSAQDLTPITQNAPIIDELQPIILQLNQLLQRLDQSLQAEQRFTADASHELRSPLSAIQLRLQVLQRKYQDQPQFTQELQLIQQDVSRGTQVLENLLLLARLDPTETADLPLSSLNLSQLVVDVWNNLEIFKQQKQIQLVSNLEPCQVKVNPELMTVCLRNLLDNAIRYSQPHGRVYIQVTAEQQQGYLCIENEGEEVDSNTISRLGERFYRALGSKTTGSGLGLSICKKIVQLHHASIDFSVSSYGGLKVELYFRKFETPEI